MDPDMNKYDLNHRVAHHGKMSDADWEEAYRAAWQAFYTPEHINTILRRTCACPIGRPGTTLSTILWFYLTILYEGVHPLESGAFRLKYRRDRRRGMKRENPLVFYPRYWGGMAVKAVQYCARLSALQGDAEGGARRRPTAGAIPISPSRRRKADEFDALDLYHATTGGEAALKRKYRDDAIRAHTTHDAGRDRRRGGVIALS